MLDNACPPVPADLASAAQAESQPRVVSGNVALQQPGFNGKNVSVVVLIDLIGDARQALVAAQNGEHVEYAR